MCSIMGCWCPLPESPGLSEGFARTKSRGPDDSRVVETADGVLAFHRLAIMDLEPTGCSPLSWGAACSSATARSTALKKRRRSLRQIQLQERLGLRGPAPALVRARPGDVQNAGRGVRPSSSTTRGAGTSSRRVTRSASAPLLGGTRAGGPLRQRGEEPRRPRGEGPALPAGLLVAAGEFHRRQTPARSRRR